MQTILIKNGLVYDPLTHTAQKRDLAVQAGRIADPAQVQDALVQVDAAGCLVTPGLIDLHAHVLTSVSDGAVNADMLCLPNGVTTCVDGGTAGTACLESGILHDALPAQTRVLTLMHTTPEGLCTGLHGENQTPAFWDREKLRELAQRWPDHIAGLKVRMSRSLLDPYGLTTEPLEETVALAEELGLKVVVHTVDPNVDTQRVAQLLRPGDIFCHVYGGKTENILDENGLVKPGIRQARERGVLFDACNGRGNFLFKVAKPAIEQGFAPDIISSDANPLTYYTHPLVTLPRLLSKYLALGMDLYDVLDTATINAARWLGREELASMAEGTEADIAVFRLTDKDCEHRDFSGERVLGHQVLVPQMTIRAGQVAYSQVDFL